MSCMSALSQLGPALELSTLGCFKYTLQDLQRTALGRPPPKAGPACIKYFKSRRPEIAA